jgi:hypothetical protein
MARAPTDIRSLARSHTDSALKVLQCVMNQPEAPPAARVAAAQALLDRGWGKPAQAQVGHDGGPIKLEVAWATPGGPAPAEQSDEA